MNILDMPLDDDIEEVMVEVQIERDYLFIEAEMELTIVHEGKHPFGSSEVINKEIKSLQCYGDDGEDVAPEVRNGIDWKKIYEELFTKAEEKWRSS